MSDATMGLFAPIDDGSRGVEANSADARDGIRANLILGAAVTVMLIAGGGLWLGLTKIAGAVIAPATVVVESNIKKVQHLTIALAEARSGQ